MNFTAVLAVLDNVATIVTGVCAAGAFGHYLWRSRSKKKRVEDYLAGSKDGSDYKLLSVMELVAELGMSEAEIVDAAFRSRHIQRFSTPEMQGAPARLLLRYSAREVRRGGPPMVSTKRRDTN